MAKNPQKPGNAEPVREQNEKGTGGWQGPVLPPEKFNPPVETPKPKDHGETAVPE